MFIDVFWQRSCDFLNTITHFKGIYSGSSGLAQLTIGKTRKNVVDGFLKLIGITYHDGEATSKRREIEVI